MYDAPEKKKSEFALIQLMPNLMTIGAICAGLSAIRFAISGNFKLAVMLILLAAVLDGLDGRLARALRSVSKMGAELDSLADFLNFGVATPMVIYLWALQDMRGIGVDLGAGVLGLLRGAAGAVQCQQQVGRRRTKAAQGVF